MEAKELLHDSDISTNIKLFVNKVIKNSERLIDANIWQGIDKARLDNWLQGINEQDETGLLAACLLDNLLYRSKDQLISLIKNVFVLCEQRYSVISALQNINNSDILITPVLGANQPPTKSGPYILRLAAREYKFHDKNMIWPFNLIDLEHDVKTLIFIDDFCGTGNQFIKFAEKSNISKLFNSRENLKLIYLCASAHEDGIKAIESKYPYVEIFCSDKLTQINNFFSEKYFERYGLNKLNLYIWDKYKELMKFHQLPYNGNIGYEGYGKLGLSYAFFHAVPNSTLPIFWASSDSWAPLLDR